MLLIWAVGYFMAMKITVAGLPVPPFWGLLVFGMMFLGLGLMRDKKNK